MIQINKFSDYAIVILVHMSKIQDQSLFSAKALSTQLHLPLPTVSKILKQLQKASILESIQGPRGGYRLAKTSDEISVGQILEIMEGPIAITECALSEHQCSVTSWCEIKPHWRLVNQVVREALERLKLSALSQQIQRSDWKQSMDRVWSDLFEDKTDQSRKEDKA
ncbi:MAG: SUF system Fe-S cluster assembly regulator [Bdellovibrionota bacterium]